MNVNIFEEVSMVYRQKYLLDGKIENSFLGHKNLSCKDLKFKKNKRQTYKQTNKANPPPKKKKNCLQIFFLLQNKTIALLSIRRIP